MYLSEFFQNNPEFFALMLVWSIFWKGMSMWKAAHQEKKYWFIVLLVLNTVGLLDIFYIYILPKLRKKEEDAVVVELEDK